jgi:hypothetical protein
MAGTPPACSARQERCGQAMALQRPRCGLGAASRCWRQKSVRTGLLRMGWPALPLREGRRAGLVPLPSCHDRSARKLHPGLTPVSAPLRRHMVGRYNSVCLVAEGIAHLPSSLKYCFLRNSEANLPAIANPPARFQIRIWWYLAYTTKYPILKSSLQL